MDERCKGCDEGPGAIACLKKQAYVSKHAPFAQVSALKSLHLIPAETKQTIDTFLAQDPVEEPSPEGLAVTAPEANANEF